jgi:hypothetical protein
MCGLACARQPRPCGHSPLRPVRARTGTVPGASGCHRGVPTLTSAWSGCCKLCAKHGVSEKGGRPGVLSCDHAAETQELWQQGEETADRWFLAQVRMSLWQPSCVTAKRAQALLLARFACAQRICRACRCIRCASRELPHRASQSLKWRSCEYASMGPATHGTAISPRVNGGLTVGSPCTARDRA